MKGVAVGAATHLPMSEMSLRYGTLTGQNLGATTGVAGMLSWTLVFLNPKCHHGLKNVQTP